MKIRGNYGLFLGNADAKNSSKNAEHMCIFGEKATILGALGALGQVWRRDWNRGGPKGPFCSESLIPFGGHFGNLRAFLRVYFLVYFRVPSFRALWVFWERKGGQKGGFGRLF